MHNDCYLAIFKTHLVHYYFLAINSRAKLLQSNISTIGALLVIVYVKREGKLNSRIHIAAVSTSGQLYSAALLRVHSWR